MIDLKKPAEIEKMRAAGRVVHLVLKARRAIAPGITTGELEDLAVRIFRSMAARRRFWAMRLPVIRLFRPIPASRSTRRSYTAFPDAAS